jgi:ferric-dicitrate binding protein FerR (iron transport regulator)
MNSNTTYYTDLITRYFSGEITEEELHVLSGWIKADPQHEETFRQFHKTSNLVEKQSFRSKINTDKEWVALQAKMTADVLPANESTKTIQLNTAKRPASLFYNRWMAAAAVVVLLISTVQLYYYFSKPSIIIVSTKDTNFDQLLPDGSIVTLHAGSQISYPEKFESDTRNLELKGEAYFKVAHDKTKPFIVACGEARVEVLGTEFNVNTKTAAGSMEVVLTAGKVSVYYTAKPQNNILLLPGEKAELETNKQLISKSSNTDPNYMAWKTRVLVFDNQTLEQVVNTLQNVYQTPIVLAEPELSGCTVTASFNNQTLQSVLEVLKITLNLQLNSRGKVIEISGKSCK